MPPVAIPATSFLDRSGLPARWRRCERFVALDTNFRDGERFLACWHAWRSDRPGRVLDGYGAGQLHVVAVAPRLPGADELHARWAHSSTLAPLAAELLAEWPPAVHGLHRLAFDNGEVQLLLAVGGTAREWLPRLSARVDAYFIDGSTLADYTDPAWPLRLFKAAGRLAAPGATLVVPGAGDAARAALRTAGFVPSAGRGTGVAAGASSGAVVAETLWCGRHAPAFAPRGGANHRTGGGSGGAGAAATPPERHVLIVGAGLAGCATAWALAELGWHSTLLDRHDAPAREASGNPGGLFHGTVHRQDGAHARFNRAAALEARRAVRIAIDRHGVSGGTDGLLRIDTGGSAASPGSDGQEDADVPADYARIVDAAEASALAGIPIAHRCWYFAGGGWVQPAGLARAFIERGGARVRFVGGVSVASLRRPGGAAGADWQLLDPLGRVVGESAIVVLAHAGDASALLAGSVLPSELPQSAVVGSTTTAPLQSVRGQSSWLPAAELAQALPGLGLPRLPIVGSGWLLPAVDGSAVFGATAQADDGDPSVRASDHAANVAALARLTGLRLPAEPPPALLGRTAWRCVAADRLPLIGAVPGSETGDGAEDACHDHAANAAASPPAGAAAGTAAQRHRPAGRIEHLPRVPGLYTFSALGSRGITWAALGGQLLASMIAGAPVPLPRALIEAVDPGRFVLRQQRRVPRR